jgi:hypothetical protein
MCPDGRDQRRFDPVLGGVKFDARKTELKRALADARRAHSLTKVFFGIYVIIVLVLFWVNS